jgi:hypothetical protein
VKQDDLSVCYRKIDAPLVPVYLRPMSGEHVEKIKQLWDKLRYIRVDLWSRLRSRSPTPDKNRNTISSNSKLHYQLTKESLSQLLGLVWTVVPQRPDYYIAAMENQKKTIENRLQTKQQARINQQRLEKTRSRQLLQTEHICFMLAALLETPKCIKEPPSLIIQEINPLE